MGHLTLELILWLLLAFFIGCIIGCLFRKMFGGAPEAVGVGAGAAVGAGAGAAVSKLAPKPVEKPQPVAAPVAPAPVAKAKVVEKKVEAKPAPKPKAAKPAPKAAPAPKPKPKPQPVAATGVGKRPKGLSGARSGKADELQRISGVGPKLEKTLHSLGFFHFDQISAWSRDEVLWVDEHLRFKGRIDRDEWIAQSELLAGGDEEKFAKLYGTGGIKDRKTAKTKSGSKTRKSK